MKAVYEATHPIPALGVGAGDIITVRPSHPENPLLVTRRHGREILPAISHHLRHFSLVDADGEPQDVIRACRPALEVLD